MNTGPEHYAEAERLLSNAEGVERDSHEERYSIAVAQVHATLALAAATVDARRGGSEVWQAWPTPPPEPFPPAVPHA